MQNLALDMTIVKETKLYDEAVSLTGYGKYNLYILLATGGCLMCVIIETMCMSFIIPAAQCDLNLSLTEKGILVSISFLGIFTTSFFWGVMADVRGRRNILIFSLITSSLISLVCSIIPWAWVFILLRFLNGALIGGSSFVLYAFAGEFHNDRHRPMIISWISSFFAAGQIYIPGMAWIILPNDWSFYIEALGISFRPWRLLLIVYAMPSLVVAAMVSVLPESPKFLLAKGDHDHTLKILTKMFVFNTGKKPHEYPVSTIILDEVTVRKTEGKPSNVFKLLWRQTRFLFKKEFLVKTLLCCYLQFGVFLSASALALWFPDILNLLSKYAQTVSNSEVTLCASVHYQSATTNLQRLFYNIYEERLWRIDSNDTLEETACDDSVHTEVFLVVLLIGSAVGITYIIIGLIINRVGKKTLIVGFAAVTAICGLVAQYISGYITILVLYGVFIVGSGLVGVVNALAVDLYPTHIRAMALAVSLMFGRLGALVGSNVVGVIFYSNCEYIFIFFAINHILIILAAIFIPTEKQQEIAPNETKRQDE